VELVLARQSVQLIVLRWNSQSDQCQCPDPGFFRDFSDPGFLSPDPHITFNNSAVENKSLIFKVL
jgi:hypothetical protein